MNFNKMKQLSLSGQEEMESRLDSGSASCEGEDCDYCDCNTCQYDCENHEQYSAIPLIFD